MILEITETTITRNFEACKQVVEELRALGLGVSIDDFGAGFTSLAYLGSLAVTELKLDRTFLTDLTAHGNQRDVQLVRGTIELAHALGLVVVAEGIEICATLELLALLGCDRAQGYFVGRPVAARDLVFDQRASDIEVPVAPPSSQIQWSPQRPPDCATAAPSERTTRATHDSERVQPDPPNRALVC